MPRSRHLHLDDVITSMPELGPTIPDGGYSWLVLLGIMAIQITVPSVLTMYGVVLGYLEDDDKSDIDLWNERHILTPVLFIAFWSLAEPWSRTIVGLASVPRLVAAIGVILLSIGVLASGYLATGGVGAYLSRLTAGMVMGIGASLILAQSENMLRKHFRTRLVLVLTLRNVSFSVGVIFIPVFTHALLIRAGLQQGLLLMTTTMVPACLGAVCFRVAALKKTTPYTLLISQEDTELSVRNTPDVTRGRHDNPGNSYLYTDLEGDGDGPPPLFGEGSNSYAYEDPEIDVNLFVTPVSRSGTTWREEFQILGRLKFWSAVAASIGMKTAALSLWVILPPMALSRLDESITLFDAVLLLVAVGVGTLGPSIASYWSPKTARWRSIYFGGMCWLGNLSLLGLAYSSEYSWMVTYALMGGISMGGTAASQETALRDALGSQTANRAHTAQSSIVGLTLLMLSFIQSYLPCLLIAAMALFLGGMYWTLTPLLGAIRARWPR